MKHSFKRNHIKVLQLRFLLKRFLLQFSNSFEMCQYLLSNIVRYLHFLLCVFKPLSQTTNESIFILEIIFSGYLEILNMMGCSSSATWLSIKEKVKPKTFLHSQQLSENYTFDILHFEQKSSKLLQVIDGPSHLN